MSLPTPLQSTAAFRAAFADGLARLSARGEVLGGYILVLANAAQDPALWQQLASRLKERHDHLAALLTSTLRQGRIVDFSGEYRGMGGAKRPSYCRMGPLYWPILHAAELRRVTLVWP